MDAGAEGEPSRKRRAITACSACRTAKVACVGGRPCVRCARNGTACYDVPTPAPTTLTDPQRIERLEAEVRCLQNALNAILASTPSVPVLSGPASPGRASAIPIRTASAVSFSFRDSGAGEDLSNHFTWATPTVDETSWSQPPCVRYTAVEEGLVTWEQATLWFNSFFKGSHALIPVFCEKTDTFQSVSKRSPFLFDCILAIGCRAEEGLDPKVCHDLQARMDTHLSNIIAAAEKPSLEMIQAIAIMAGYSDNGMVLISLAIRLAKEIQLHETMVLFMTPKVTNAEAVTELQKHQYRLMRVWLGICNLELFFSLDGGRLPSTRLMVMEQRVAVMVNHPDCTNSDIRLFSQIKLNSIRSQAYRELAEVTKAQSMNPSAHETWLRELVPHTCNELSLWRDGWEHIIKTRVNISHQALALLNLRIQYEWAFITLHLKTLQGLETENIAMMSDFQRDMVRVAKEAAVRHLHLLLETPLRSSSPRVGPPNQPSPSAYLSTFKWAISFVWAKCAFSVLLALKLSILLQDPPLFVMSLLSEAKQVLKDLQTVRAGHTGYIQILQESVEKCEEALRSYLQDQDNGEIVSSTGNGGHAEDEFQGYAPSEFVFKWDFPGLNLRHVPIRWQDLFVNMD